mmetsp:Transcript_132437/g.423905  ORF Transcript_132437/g.423905 Transcript_132437/m.423905 type:complete len:205 (+) Transcript_132437:377-991(+)
MGHPIRLTHSAGGVCRLLFASAQNNGFRLRRQAVVLRALRIRVVQLRCCAGHRQAHRALCRPRAVLHVEATIHSRRRRPCSRAVLSGGGASDVDVVGGLPGRRLRCWGVTRARRAKAFFAKCPCLARCAKTVRALALGSCRCIRGATLASGTKKTTQRRCDRTIEGVLLAIRSNCHTSPLQSFVRQRALSNQALRNMVFVVCAL